MSRSATERIVHRAAAVGVTAVAAVAIPMGGEPELFLVMLAAVIAGLACFDTSMEPEFKSFAPWLFLSLAPVARTVPVVWSDLQSGADGVDERFEHIGSLMLGVCVLGAVWWVARPARRLGAHGTLHDTAVILGSAVSVGLAGTSVAFLYDADFGSVAVARAIESSTWAVVGGLLAAVVLAASRAVRPTASLSIVLVTAAATVALLAYSVAGSDVDAGWWAMVYAGLALGAGAFSNPMLGQREERSRRTSAGVVLALIMGLGAAAAAIAARSDSDAWAPGTWALGAMALAMLALAMASRPVDEQRRDDAAAARGAVSVADRGAAVAEDASEADSKVDLAAMFGPESGAESRLASVFGAEAEAEARLASMLATSGGDRSLTELAASSSGQSHLDSSTETLGDGSGTAFRDAAISASTAQIVGGVADQAAGSAHPNQSNVLDQPSDSQRSAHSTAASESSDRVLDPIGRGHHVDPSTGLLSAAGLQQALVDAFSRPRPGGQLTLMMFMIRDLDEIESQHGRLASAAVTRTIAHRVSVLMPDGKGARFARSAYAVIFEGEPGDPSALVQHLAQVLLQLRTPIDGHAGSGESPAPIDVVAGMAQAYTREDVASFVKRANAGLARAAQTAEPTLVAMP